MSIYVDGSNYFKQNTVTDAALKHMENLPTMHDLDTESTI